MPEEPGLSRPKSQWQESQASIQSAKKRRNDGRNDAYAGVPRGDH